MNSGMIESPGVVRSLSGTSAGGSLVSKSLRMICIAGAIYVQGTVSAGAPLNVTPDTVIQTNSGYVISDIKAASAAIMELRRLTGMTWDQLARLFGVARRTVHFWASGKPLNAGNEEKLRRVLAAVRQIDRGTARANRDVLFTARSDGILPFDLLQNEQYNKVIDYLGDRGGRQRPRVSPLSKKELLSRAPLKPADLVNAIQDKAHRDTGRSRPARAVRVKGTSHGDKT